MKILFIAKKKTGDHINFHLKYSLEQLGHNVVLFDYVKVAMRYGKHMRDPILLRVFYEQKPDIVILSKGNSISPEMISKIKESVPLIFVLYGSHRSFRMHPEVFTFAEISDLVIVTEEDAYDIFSGLKNIYFIEKDTLGEFKTMAPERKDQKNLFLEYEPIKIQKRYLKDVTFVDTKEIDIGKTVKTSTISTDDLIKLDANDLKKFIRTCSSSKIFIVESGFKEKNTLLYNKMTLSGSLIIETNNDVVEIVSDLLRWYMKRKSMLHKNIKEAKDSLTWVESPEPDETVSMNINDMVSKFIDIVLKSKN